MAALLLIGLVVPGEIARAQDARDRLDMAFINGLIGRGPAFFGVAKEVSTRIEADTSRSEFIRGWCCFKLADILRLEAQEKSDDPALLQKFNEQMERAKKLYPKQPRAKGADFDILRSEVNRANRLCGQALPTEDPDKIQRARAEAKPIYERALAILGDMIQRFDQMESEAASEAAKGEAEYKRDLAELFEADAYYSYAVNIFDEGEDDRTAHLEKGLQKYDHFVDERFKFQNLLGYAYMGRGRCLFELGRAGVEGRMEEAAEQFEELTYFSVGLEPKDPQFKKDIAKLENDVRLEAFYMSIRTRLAGGDVDGGLQGALELFGTWLATVEGLKPSETGFGDNPKEVREWVKAYLPPEMAEQAFKMAEDADAARKRGQTEILAGRSVKRVRDPAIRVGIMALLESGRAIAKGGDYDRGGGLLEALIEDSKGRDPKVSAGSDLDIYGLTAAKVLSEILDENGGALPPMAAFYAGKGFEFRGKFDEALAAYRMAVAGAGRIGERDYAGRALMEIGKIYYEVRKEYLQAGLAFEALASRYPEHREQAAAARNAEKAFGKVEGDGECIRKLVENARALVQRSGKGVAPERHTFERAQDLAERGEFLEAAETFLQVRERVTTQDGEVPVPFYRVARVKGGEYLYREADRLANGGNPDGGKAHIDRSIEILREAVAKAEEERDMRAWAMGTHVLGGMVLASPHVKDFAAASEVLSALDREPGLEKEVVYAALSRERQVFSLVQLGRLEEAEAAYGRLESYEEAAGGDETKLKTIRKAIYQAAWTLATDLQDKGAEDPTGEWEKRAAPYAARVVELAPRMSPEREFDLLAWAGSLIFAGEMWEEAVRTYERMLEVYEANFRDRLELKDGRTVDGEVIEEDQNEVKIWTGEKMETFGKVDISRRAKRLPKAIREKADRARTDLGEAYVELKNGEKSVGVFRVLFERPEYKMQYRVLEGFARAQLLRFHETNDDRWLTPKGAARDLFQILLGKLKGAGEDGYETFKRPGDPPYERKLWLVTERILAILLLEGDFDSKKFDEVLQQVEMLEKVEGLDRKDFEFPDIRDRIMELRKKAEKRKR